MRKIMFNDHYGLTEAVLSGRKTQTRRIIPKYALEKVDKFMVDYHNATFDVLTEMEALQQYFFIEKIGKLPFKVGEVVAVAQSYKGCGFDPNTHQIWTDKGVFIFEDCPISQLAGWNNKLFVLAALMPNRIRITNVRVERLQDISDEDCIKEGIYKDDGKTYFNGYAFQIVRDQYGNMLSKQWYSTPREAYAALIDKISGKGTWESNPYVFVYDFELVD